MKNTVPALTVTVFKYLLLITQAFANQYHLDFTSRLAASGRQNVITNTVRSVTIRTDSCFHTGSLQLWETLDINRSCQHPYPGQSISLRFNDLIDARYNYNALRSIDHSCDTVASTVDIDQLSVFADGHCCSSKRYRTAMPGGADLFSAPALPPYPCQ